MLGIDDDDVVVVARFVQLKLLLRARGYQVGTVGGNGRGWLWRRREEAGTAQAPRRWEEDDDDDDDGDKLS